jgi:hypothetical protein
MRDLERLPRRGRTMATALAAVAASGAAAAGLVSSQIGIGRNRAAVCNLEQLHDEGRDNVTLKGKPAKRRQHETSGQLLI